MAGTFGDYLENKLLDLAFGAVAFTAPATVYAAAYTVAFNDAGTGGTEVSGNAYARVAVTNNLTNFPAASGGAKTNGTALIWPMATPAGWGTIVAVGFWDASSGGNFLGGDPAITPVAVALNSTFRVQAGALALSQT